MKYEYKVVDLDVSEPSAESRLNELGEEGWELVAVVTSEGSGPSGYLKRPARNLGARQGTF